MQFYAFFFITFPRPPTWLKSPEPGGRPSPSSYAIDLKCPNADVRDPAASLQVLPPAVA